MTIARGYRAIVLTTVIAAIASMGLVHAAEQYAYYYEGRLVAMSPSRSLVAVGGAGAGQSAFARQNGLVRDALSDQHALADRGLVVYRAPAPKDKQAPVVDLSARIGEFARGATAEVVQPVFEAGMMWLIPCDEVIVGLKASTDLQSAEAYLAQKAAELGITGVRAHRPNTFVLKIEKPADGRCYEVAQALSALDKVGFAEPNHVVVRAPVPSLTVSGGPKAREALHVAMGGGQAPPPDGETNIPMPPSWTTICSEGFESGVPAGWTVGWYTGYAEAYWDATTYHSHAGTKSMYCAQSGPAGAPAPGPPPYNMDAALRTPLYNLTSYEEVYIEVWFYAKNDLWPDPGGSLYDYCALWVVDNDAGGGNGRYLGISAAGDCTTDPTTASGWRRCLYRVPPTRLVANAYFEFEFVSDNFDPRAEGVYVDDVRIVGTTNVDTEPLGTDTYGARHWELKNAGQIAGLGNDNNDLHCSEAWGLGAISTGVVVAVIDTGVDLTHPDLNLVTGYDYDGSVGGGPKTSSDNHGTSCAGDVGAIRDNAIGVIGTAPGVKIMPIFWGSTYADLASAIDVAVAHGADVLSNSWGWVGAPSTVITTAITSALAAGRTVLFAAGNGPDRSPWTYDVAYPGSLTASTDLICVGATSMTDEHKAAASSDGSFSWGSSYVGVGPDVCAPGPWDYTTDRQGAAGYNAGGDITGADSGDYTHDFSGTSSSTPKVAGIAALVLSKDASLTPGQVKQILRDSADDIDVAGVDDKTGAGRVNAYAAVQAASSGPHVEHGIVNAGSSWRWVTFSTQFANPVVVAGPASKNNASPGVIRLRWVGSSGFAIRFQEWDYLDGSHPQEKIPWVAVEAGNYDLGSGNRLVAAKFWTNKTNPNAPRKVMFPQPFSGWPVVLAQVQTNQGVSAVTDRIVKIFNGMFAMVMQEEEAGGTHGGEQIGYIAVSQGVTDIGGVTCEAKRSWVKLKHTGAWVGTALGGTQVFVEEEQSADTEVEHWIAEYGGFLGLGGQPPYVGDLQTCWVTATSQDTCLLRCTSAMALSNTLAVSAQEEGGAALGGVVIVMSPVAEVIVTSPEPVVRRCEMGGSVTLTAPESVVDGAEVLVFSHWQLDGKALAAGEASVEVEMSRDHAALAVYLSAPGTGE